MANLDNLLESVAKAEAKVEKCKKTIERHEKQLEKKIQKVNDETGIDLTGKTKEEVGKIRDQRANNDSYWALCEVVNKLNDIKGAKEKLKIAENTLGNWQGRLNIKINEQKFIENNAPQVIVDFLNDWKEKVYSYYIKQYDNYQSTKETLNRAKEETAIEFIENNKDSFEDYIVNGEVHKNLIRMAINYNKAGINDHLQLNKLDDKSIQKQLSKYLDGTLQEMLRIYKDAERVEWLNKLLETEKQAKLLDMVTRISGITGEITDASYLKVSGKGNLDGYVVGKEGKAKVETIGAGGYHIQRFHYRTLVHKMD